LKSSFIFLSDLLIFRFISALALARAVSAFCVASDTFLFEAFIIACCFLYCSLAFNFKSFS
jgi:uncharacterized membrane protein YcaP (DUF421 family)